MGLKSGSRDSGLDDGEEADERTDAVDAETGDDASTTETGAEGAATQASGAATADASATEGDDRPSMSSIPYKLRRNKVNEGREQVPYFLREEVVEGEEELQGTLEDLLGENVYKSDYREAAMVVAQRNPDLIAEVLREWGYDLDSA